MLNVYLLRHGQTAWNADNNRYCGRTDIPLTAKGIQQAEAVREQLKGIEFDGVYSSPLERAFMTANIASGAYVKKDDRLIEADFGGWEHKTKEEFIAEAPEHWHRWMEDPYAHRAGGSGENGREIVERVNAFFTDVHRKHPAGNILVAAHNGVNRLFLAYKLGMPLRNYRMLVQENASVTMFTLDASGGFTLQHLNAKF